MLVIGAGSGIGAALLSALLAQGAKIVAVNMRKYRLADGHWETVTRTRQA